MPGPLNSTDWTLTPHVVDTAKKPNDAFFTSEQVRTQTNFNEVTNEWLRDKLEDENGVGFGDMIVGWYYDLALFDVWGGTKDFTKEIFGASPYDAEPDPNFISNLSEGVYNHAISLEGGDPTLSRWTKLRNYSEYEYEISKLKIDVTLDAIRGESPFFTPFMDLLDVGTVVMTMAALAVPSGGASLSIGGLALLYKGQRYFRSLKKLKTALDKRPKLKSLLEFSERQALFESGSFAITDSIKAISQDDVTATDVLGGIPIDYSIGFLGATALNAIPLTKIAKSLRKFRIAPTESEFPHTFRTLRDVRKVAKTLFGSKVNLNDKGGDVLVEIFDEKTGGVLSIALNPNAPAKSLSELTDFFNQVDKIKGGGLGAISVKDQWVSINDLEFPNLKIQSLDSRQRRNPYFVQRGRGPIRGTIKSQSILVNKRNKADIIANGFPPGMLTPNSYYGISILPMPLIKSSSSKALLSSSLRLATKEGWKKIKAKEPITGQWLFEDHVIFSPDNFSSPAQLQEALKNSVNSHFKLKYLIESKAKLKKTQTKKPKLHKIKFLSKEKTVAGLIIRDKKGKHFLLLQDVRELADNAPQGGLTREVWLNADGHVFFDPSLEALAKNFKFRKVKDGKTVSTGASISQIGKISSKHSDPSDVHKQFLRVRTEVSAAKKWIDDILQDKDNLIKMSNVIFPATPTSKEIESGVRALGKQGLPTKFDKVSTIRKTTELERLAKLNPYFPKQIERQIDKYKELVHVEDRLNEIKQESEGFPFKVFSLIRKIGEEEYRSWKSKHPGLYQPLLRMIAGQQDAYYTHAVNAQISTREWTNLLINDSQPMLERASKMNWVNKDKVLSSELTNIWVSNYWNGKIGIAIETLIKKNPQFTDVQQGQLRGLVNDFNLWSNSTDLKHLLTSIGRKIPVNPFLQNHGSSINSLLSPSNVAIVGRSIKDGSFKKIYGMEIKSGVLVKTIQDFGTYDTKGSTIYIDMFLDVIRRHSGRESVEQFYGKNFTSNLRNLVTKSIGQTALMRTFGSPDIVEARRFLEFAFNRGPSKIERKVEALGNVNELLSMVLPKQLQYHHPIVRLGREVAFWLTTGIRNAVFLDGVQNFPLVSQGMLLGMGKAVRNGFVNSRIFRQSRNELFQSGKTGTNSDIGTAAAMSLKAANMLDEGEYGRGIYSAIKAIGAVGIPLSNLLLISSGMQARSAVGHMEVAWHRYMRSIQKIANRHSVHRNKVFSDPKLWEEVTLDVPDWDLTYFGAGPSFFKEAFHFAKEFSQLDKAANKLNPDMIMWDFHSLNKDYFPQLSRRSLEFTYRARAQTQVSINSSILFATNGQIPPLYRKESARILRLFTGWSSAAGPSVLNRALVGNRNGMFMLSLAFGSGIRAGLFDLKYNSMVSSNGGLTQTAKKFNQLGPLMQQFSSLLGMATWQGSMLTENLIPAYHNGWDFFDSPGVGMGNGLLKDMATITRDLANLIAALTLGDEDSVLATKGGAVLIDDYGTKTERIVAYADAISQYMGLKGMPIWMAWDIIRNKTIKDLQNE